MKKIKLSRKEKSNANNNKKDINIITRKGLLITTYSHFNLSKYNYDLQQVPEEVMPINTQISVNFAVELNSNFIFKKGIDLENKKIDGWTVVALYTGNGINSSDIPKGELLTKNYYPSTLLDALDFIISQLNEEYKQHVPVNEYQIHRNKWHELEQSISKSPFLGSRQDTDVPMLLVDQSVADNDYDMLYEQFQDNPFLLIIR
jgi:hypothetical protein